MKRRAHLVREGTRIVLYWVPMIFVLLVIAVAMKLGTSFVLRPPAGTPPAAPTFGDLVATEVFWRLVVGLVLLSFLVNLGRQVRLLLGPGTAWALLFGRYRRPVAEERVFMFVDLTLIFRTPMSGVMCRTAGISTPSRSR